jgi:hypothetical protein
MMAAAMVVVLYVRLRKHWLPCGRSNLTSPGLIGLESYSDLETQMANLHDQITEFQELHTGE